MIFELGSWFESTNHYYLTFPHLSGGELLQRILDKRRFTEEEARRACVNILETLKYIHHNVRPLLSALFTPLGDWLTVWVRLRFRVSFIEVRCFQSLTDHGGSLTSIPPLYRFSDIKAENFLYVTRESDVDEFQLIDFGISKVRRDSPPPR